MTDLLINVLYQMWVTWMEAVVNLQEWHRVEPLISQTERAIMDFEDWEKVRLNEAISSFRWILAHNKFLLDVHQIK